MLVDQIPQQTTRAIESRGNRAFGDVESHRDFVKGQLSDFAEQDYGPQIGIDIC